MPTAAATDSEPSQVLTTTLGEWALKLYCHHASPVEHQGPKQARDVAKLSIGTAWNWRIVPPMLKPAAQTALCTCSTDEGIRGSQGVHKLNCSLQQHSLMRSQPSREMRLGCLVCPNCCSAARTWYYRAFTEPGSESIAFQCPAEACGLDRRVLSFMRRLAHRDLREALCTITPPILARSSLRTRPVVI